MDVGKILFMILKSMKKEVTRRLPEDLTFLEFKCLKIAYLNPVTQKEIVEETGMAKGTVSKALKGLEEKGFVRRKRTGREYVVEVTEKGKDIMKNFEKTVSEINEMLLKGFSEEERLAIKTLLERMLKNIEKER